MPHVARAQGQVCAQHPTTAHPTRQQGLSNGGNPFQDVLHPCQDTPHPPPKRPNLTGKFLGNPLIPYGERRRRGTGVPLCYPQAWQRVAVSVRAVVPRARLEVWIGESAASSLVTTRPVAPGRRRSRWEDCLSPPLPHLLPPSVALPLPWGNGLPHRWRHLWPSYAPSCSASLYLLSAPFLAPVA